MEKENDQLKKEKEVTKMNHLTQIHSVISMLYLILFIIDQNVINFISAPMNILGMLYIGFYVCFVFPYDPYAKKEDSVEDYP